MPEERKEFHKTTFVKDSKRAHGPGKFTFDTYGYQPDGKGVAPEYLVRITSFRLGTTVVAVLQEDILTRVESRWEPFIPTAMLTTGNLLIQAVTGGRKALITKATSRRVWQGSSPMVISLNLKFEAVIDPFKEVVEASRLLQSMALPSEPEGGVVNFQELKKDTTTEQAIEALSQVPMLGPPGPSPFTMEGVLSSGKSWNQLSQTKIVEGLKGGDVIVVEIGRYLSFWNVILREVSVLHKIKFDPSGDPISGAVNLVFESYEMMTKESLEKSYQKTSMSSTTQEKTGE